MIQGLGWTFYSSSGRKLVWFKRSTFIHIIGRIGGI